MKNTTNKESILAVLQTTPEALDIVQIIKLLEHPAPERTIRRWLAELAESNQILKTGQKRGTKYQHVQDSAETITQALDHISKPLFERKPVSYNSKWLSNYTPNKTFYFNPKQLEILKAEGSRGLEHDIGGTYVRKIYNRLLIDLSYNSSRLEGNTYSLIDTEKLLLEGISNDNKLDEECVMILNHKEAIRYIVDNGQTLSATTETIRTIHFLLSDGLIPSSGAGHIRDHAVRISGTTYTPLESQVALENTLNIISAKAQEIENPFEQSLFMLTQLAYLQAFMDVNKRTSRLAANIPLIRQNLIPLSFNDVDQTAYISAMIAIYELNDPGPLAAIYIKSYLRTCLSYNAIADAVGFDEIRVRYRAQRRALIREIILNKISEAKLTPYIDEHLADIPKADRPAFSEDVFEDLHSIGPHQLAGLVVSLEDLENWTATNNK